MKLNMASKLKYFCQQNALFTCFYAKKTRTVLTNEVLSATSY